MRTPWILLGALFLSGCQASGLSWGRSDPDAGPWALGFVTPYLMGGWVEESATVDVDGNFYRRIGSGWAAGGGKNGTELARGWAVKGGRHREECQRCKAAGADLRALAVGGRTANLSRLD